MVSDGMLNLSRYGEIIAKQENPEYKYKKKSIDNKRAREKKYSQKRLLNNLLNNNNEGHSLAVVRG
jgi:hypothetical protein